MSPSVGQLDLMLCESLGAGDVLVEQISDLGACIIWFQMPLCWTMNKIRCSKYLIWLHSSLADQTYMEQLSAYLSAIIHTSAMTASRRNDVFLRVTCEIWDCYMQLTPHELSEGEESTIIRYHCWCKHAFNLARQNPKEELNSSRRWFW